MAGHRKRTRAVLPTKQELSTVSEGLSTAHRSSGRLVYNRPRPRPGGRIAAGAGKIEAPGRGGGRLIGSPRGGQRNGDPAGTFPGPHPQEEREKVDLRAADLQAIWRRTGRDFDFHLAKVSTFDSPGYPQRKQGVAGFSGQSAGGMPVQHTQETRLDGRHSRRFRTFRQGERASRAVRNL